MDPIVQLATAAIESFVLTGRGDVPDSIRGAVPKKRAGAFVSIHSKYGDLRGCIGTITPTCKTLADEIIQNARWACSEDHRFDPVRKHELGSLSIKVDVLSEPESINSPDQLDPDEYGVIVSASNKRRGVLLPSLDGIDTAEEQIAICRRKGGIRPSEPVTLQRFTVERHK
jgi:AmmeMemoRadiSam system protein A